MDNPDMVERLRTFLIADEDGNEFRPAIVNEAADEIERLRAAIAALTTPADGLGERLERLFHDDELLKDPGANLAWFIESYGAAILTALRAAQPTERGAIVAWLRAKADDFENAIEWSPVGKNLYSYWAEGHTQAADAIERGEHLTPTDTPATASRDAPKPPHQETDNG